MKRRTALVARRLAAASRPPSGALRGRAAAALPPPPTQGALEALRAERDALQATGSAKRSCRHGEKSLGQAPKAGIMIGIPTSFTRSIVEQVVTGLFGETTLTLRNLKVHKEGEVKAKMLIRKRTLGEYVLDVRIHEVQGLLKPGKPTLTFGRNTIDLTLPVRLAEGEGDADLQLPVGQQGAGGERSSAGTSTSPGRSAAAWCPRTTTSRAASTSRRPGETIVLSPRFPDLAVRIFVDPSEQAWAGGGRASSRSGARAARSPSTRWTSRRSWPGILGKGFNVKIPQKIFKPIRLPAGVSQSLEVQGIKLALEVKPTGRAGGRRPDLVRRRLQACRSRGPGARRRRRSRAQVAGAQVCGATATVATATVAAVTVPAMKE